MYFTYTIPQPYMGHNPHRPIRSASGRLHWVIVLPADLDSKRTLPRLNSDRNPFRKYQTRSLPVSPWRLLLSTVRYLYAS